MVAIEIEMVQGGFKSRSALVAGLRKLAEFVEAGCHTVYIDSDAVARVYENDDDRKIAKRNRKKTSRCCVRRYGLPATSAPKLVGSWAKIATTARWEKR